MSHSTYTIVAAPGSPPWALLRGNEHIACFYTREGAEQVVRSHDALTAIAKEHYFCMCFNGKKCMGCIAREGLGTLKGQP
jgi:hypothetical protein